MKMELKHSLSEEFPCRSEQVKQLVDLLGVVSKNNLICLATGTVIEVPLF